MECIVKILIERYKLPQETVYAMLESEKDTDKRMMEFFKDIDTNNDKTMSRDELMALFDDDEMVDEYIKNDDLNGDDALSIEEYLLPFYQSTAVKKVKELWSTHFDKYDKNKNGKLEVAEWEDLLKDIHVVDARGDAAKALFKNYDSDGDKGISKDELYVFLKEDMLEALKTPLQEYVRSVIDKY